MTWRPAARVDRQIAALWALCAAASIALRPLWLAAAPFLPPCLWHRWTGIPCPGCGATRALVHLLHGRAEQGLAMNPLVVLGAMTFLGVGLAAPLWLALGGRIPVVPSHAHPRATLAAGAAVALNWVWLVASGV